MDEVSQEYVHETVNRNVFFALFLQRALLPQLRRAASSGPVLVQFTGSMAADVAPPRLPVYAGTKAFLESLVRGLDNDEVYFDGPTGVRYTYLSVGSVHSENHETPMLPSLSTPTSEAFGKYIVARSGCGRRTVAPYWFHAVMGYMVQLVGLETAAKFGAEVMGSLIEQAQKHR